MPSYHRKILSTPLRDAGLVEFASDDLGFRNIINDAIAECAQLEENKLAMRYDNHRQLLQLLSRLQRSVASEDARGIQCRITYGDHDEKPAIEHKDKGNVTHSPEDGWIALSGLFGEVSGRSVSEYILHRLFTTHLQPIVQPSGRIVGYEFLMRPLPEQMPFRPAELFREASKIGQHSFLDRAARHSAIRLGASHLPSGMKRFVNFLPSSLHDPEHCLNCTFQAMEDAETDPSDYVFEVMETEPLDDPRLQQVFDIYRNRGVRLALDDVGQGFATLDAVERLQPDYVKMDRKWVSQCDGDTDKQRYIEGLLERVSRFNGVVLAEGVERAEEWNYLRGAGVPLFQGYLFGRASPVPGGATAHLMMS